VKLQKFNAFESLDVRVDQAAHGQASRTTVFTPT